MHVRCSNGSKFSIQTALNATVGSFKCLLSEKCDVPADQQRLIYKGRILKDEKTLESYGASISLLFSLILMDLGARLNFTCFNFC
ncbi:Ubiquitin-like protein-NEDD8-like protein RUB3 [Platanthera guangdongensis]|uniref:Ubiquitin-like protein-NEDD8-like protein RUB3 n=1 Tax=Platanthera guangdongensis TaxID=2320717 RepID=A0ABR2M0V1_9ASPA